jgi:hypothetical protein
MGIAWPRFGIDIAEILLKVSLKHTKKQNQTNCQVFSKGAKFCIQV